MPVIPFLLVLALALGATLASPGLASADGAWIDGPLQNWNGPGQEIPSAPSVSPDLLDPRCLEGLRSAESAEDERLLERGWRLAGSYQGGWGARVITGASEFDGMCRPLGYQVFVFQQGGFAGTLSPSQMDSRTDGAIVDVQIYRGLLGGGPPRLSAQISRYGSQDAPCCPTATSRVDYEFDLSSGSPVLKPIRADTVQNPRS